MTSLGGEQSERIALVAERLDDGVGPAEARSISVVRD
jgi:hypothetical protein